MTALTIPGTTRTDPPEEREEDRPALGSAEASLQTQLRRAEQEYQELHGECRILYAKAQAKALHIHKLRFALAALGVTGEEGP